MRRLHVVQGMDRGGWKLILRSIHSRQSLGWVETFTVLSPLLRGDSLFVCYYKHTCISWISSVTDITCFCRVLLQSQDNSHIRRNLLQIK